MSSALPSSFHSTTLLLLTSALVLGVFCVRSIYANYQRAQVSETLEADPPTSHEVHRLTIPLERTVRKGLERTAWLP